MRNRTAKRAKIERENRDWRHQLVLDVRHCQLPDCEGQFQQVLTVHEIARGTGGRPLAIQERLACLVVCPHCNTEKLTNYALWPPERQVALQCLLVADIATPQEVLDVVNHCRGRARTAIEWQDVVKYLEVA